MPSFDVVNKVDLQEVTNTVNNATKEIIQRYDFKGSNTEVEWVEKEMRITIQTEDEMKMEAVRDILINHATRRNLDAESMEFKEVEAAGGKTLRREVVVKEGIEQDIAKKMVKDVKDKKMKVQVSIQGDELRVSGKKRDDLQAVMVLLKAGNYEVPLQFINMRD
jgi:uncharacterized protein YajQ (UPF0234 family)|tara:strand:- start:15 stop:506 length:492 start_codon:yes stop_codon:yes gene_type:complete